MRCLSLLMVVVLMFSSTVWAAGPVLIGSLRSTGIVLANSVPMPDGSTVRSGDEITSGPNGLAIITAPGRSRLELRAESAARLAADHVELERGAIASSRLPVTVDGFTIRPENPEGSWYAVASRDGQLFVAAHRGNVIISSASGAAPLLLAQGSVAQRPTTSQSQSGEQPQDQQQQKRRRRAGAVAGASAGGWTIGGLSHAASVALVVGVGAGVAAASVGAAVALSDDNPSPSR